MRTVTNVFRLSALALIVDYADAPKAVGSDGDEVLADSALAIGEPETSSENIPFWAPMTIDPNAISATSELRLRGELWVGEGTLLVDPYEQFELYEQLELGDSWFQAFVRGPDFIELDVHGTLRVCGEAAIQYPNSSLSEPASEWPGVVLSD